MSRVVLRFVVSCAVLALFGFLSSCGEPDCPYGYRKVEKTCFRIDAGALSVGDSSTDDTFEDVPDAGPQLHDAAIMQDAAIIQDATLATNEGGNAPGEAGVDATVGGNLLADSGSADGRVVSDATEGGGADACAQPCPGAGECREATCTGGSCGARNLAAHTPCSKGVCDGSGSCISCVDNTDCTTVGLKVCSNNKCVACSDASHCNAANHEVCNNHECEVGPYCGDRVVNQPSEKCDDGNTSTGDACVNCKDARCGDGFVHLQVEYCEPTVAPYNYWTCNAATCQASREYAACNDDTDCPPDPWQCLNGRCTKMCTNIGECPPVPTGGGSTGCAFFCINNCNVDADCAPLHFCMRGSNVPATAPGLCTPRPCTGGCPTGTTCQGSYCVPP